MAAVKKSRKVHICDNCKQNIEKGEKYKYDIFYVKASYDSEFDYSYSGYMKTWRTHFECKF